jgi:hypothetical protein
MGMDVYGKNPTSETGKYFRNNVWWWRPLWDYCVLIGGAGGPGKDGPINGDTARAGHFNDGRGLGKKGSLVLAELLQTEVDAGRTAEYAKKRDAELDALPDQDCKICGGTGSRSPAPVCGPGPVPCNGCVTWESDASGDPTKAKRKPGNGKVRPPEASYPFSVDNVREFIAFLRDSGGFEIH